jgi:hypothetical protein
VDYMVVVEEVAVEVQQAPILDLVALEEMGL